MPTESTVQRFREPAADSLVPCPVCNKHQFYFTSKADPFFVHTECEACGKVGTDEACTEAPMQVLPPIDETDRDVGFFGFIFRLFALSGYARRAAWAIHTGHWFVMRTFPTWAIRELRYGLGDSTVAREINTQAIDEMNARLRKAYPQLKDRNRAS